MPSSIVFDFMKAKTTAELDADFVMYLDWVKRKLFNTNDSDYWEQKLAQTVLEMESRNGPR